MRRQVRLLKKAMQINNMYIYDDLHIHLLKDVQQKLYQRCFNLPRVVAHFFGMLWVA